jgi:hypothetical protein
MKPGLSLATLLLLSGAGALFADSVELNGITSLFGENTAFLVLYSSSQADPISFALTEGGSRYGVRLVAVDFAHRRAEIEQAGETQYLRLCTAPDAALGLDPAGKPGWLRGRRLSPQELSQLGRFLNEDAEAQQIKSGTPVVNPVNYGAPYPASAKSDAAPGSAADASSSGSASGSSTGSSMVTSSSSPSGAATGSDAAASAATDYTKQYWYVASLGIERNRIATASQVLSGAMSALPRTPLTPANTPADLVGAETFFGSHIPGFPDTSSVDGFGND